MKDKVEAGCFRQLAPDFSLASTLSQEGQICLRDLFESYRSFWSPKLSLVREYVAERVKRDGYCLLKNVPVDFVDVSSQSKNGNIAEQMIVTLTSLLGQPLGFNTQRDGAVIQNIRPEVSSSNEDPSGTNTNSLAWHTEDAALKFNCDYIALICLRNDSGTSTFLSRLDELGLPDCTLDALKKPHFNINADGSYKTYQSNPHPILTYEEGQAIYRVDPEFTQPLNANAVGALSELLKAADRSKLDIVLEPGNLLIFDNNIFIHGRSKIDYADENQIRWLQRLMIFNRDIPSGLIDPHNLTIKLD